jgi:NAD(P)-dependent dehydrogenase (short-subunit alcohol dehydrogenase family)
MSNNIKGKVVITGASSGLGEATARCLCAQGASVVLGARRIDRIRSLADELTGSGGKALAITTDVTFVGAGYDRRPEIDAAYRTKYRRYAASIISHLVSPEARSATIELAPRIRAGRMGTGGMGRTSSSWLDRYT